MDMGNTRAFWVDTMLKIGAPVLTALSRGELKKTMPIRGKGSPEAYGQCTYLEALGRTLTGMAPWLECGGLSGEEEALRLRYTELARKAVANGVDPESPDHMVFDRGGQPIVDTAFLAHALLRAPRELWEKQDEDVKRNIVAAMKQTRTRKPAACNWLLFSAIIEAFLCYAGEPDWDPMRIDYAVRQHEQWYQGDGIYGDGPEFHFDYYNSFVIQPMLIDILRTVGGHDNYWKALSEGAARKRAIRYGAIQEKLIGPDGSYPVIGRSAAYRFGAFQHLAQMALQDTLAEELVPAQVRCGLTAVIRRVMAFPNFDENGWLQIGVCGVQPDMGEIYISTGSLYLCCAVFLPLGLPPAHPFWSGEDAPWSSLRIWRGDDSVHGDHAI